MADTLGSIRLRPEHAALAELARVLAEQIDAGAAAGRSLEVLHKLTPRLAGVLRELGATPASGGRSNAAGGDDDPPDPDGERELAELERDVDTRPDRAARLDPAAS